MTSELRNRILSAGDPYADKVARQLYETGQAFSKPLMNMNLLKNGESVPDETPVVLQRYMNGDDFALMPAWADYKQLEIASKFAQDHYLTMAMGLLFYSLPYTYCFAKCAHALHATEKLTENVNNRVYTSAEFIRHLYAPNAFSKDGFAIRSIQKIRLIHSSIRYQFLHEKHSHLWDACEHQFPCSQYHCYLMFLHAFYFGQLYGVSLMGQTYTIEERDAFLHLWRVTSYILGIDEELIFAEYNIEEELIITDSSRELVRSLIGFIQEEIIPGDIADNLAYTFMRFYLGDEISNELQLKPGPDASILMKILIEGYSSKDQVQDNNPAVRELIRSVMEFGVNQWLHCKKTRVPFYLP